MGAVHILWGKRQLCPDLADKRCGGEMGGMTWAARIFTGLIAFVVVEQIIIAGIAWHHTNPAAVAAYAARADLRILSDAELNAIGGQKWSYQSCEHRRFLLVYKGLMCIDRMIASERFPCDGKNCPDVYTAAIHYWAPHSALNPFKGAITGYYFEPYTRGGLWVMNLVNRNVLERSE